MKVGAFALPIIIIVLLIFVFRRRYVKVKVGNRYWNVLNYSNKHEAAMLLARVNSSMILFMKHLKNKYIINGEARGRRYMIIMNMLKNYNPDEFYENSPYGNDTSFTNNKGSSMYICCRDRDDPNKLVDYNTLMFVLLHESSHIANYDGWGHEDDFWDVFSFILSEAVIAGVYTPVDYAKNPVKYCGMIIDHYPRRRVVF